MTSLSIFQSAGARLLEKLGLPSTLNGVSVGRVNIEHDVSTDAGVGRTADDNYVAPVRVACIRSAHSSRVGDTLVHPDGEFVLSRLLEDDGVMRHFVITKVS